MPLAQVTIQPGQKSGDAFLPLGKAIPLQFAEIDESTGLAVKMTSTMSACLESGEYAEVEYQRPNASSSNKAICEIGIQEDCGDGWVWRSFHAPVPDP